MTDEMPSEPLRGIVAALRQPVAVPPDLSRRVRYRQQVRHRLQYLTTIGTFTVVAVLCLLAIRRRRAQPGTVFALDAPRGRTVALVGDFTDWRTDRIRLAREPSGQWQVTLKLPPGRYRFAYLVDNTQWYADAHAAPALDDFGRPTSVITVAAR